MASPLAAASAYANIARLASDPTRALTGAQGAGGDAASGFAAMLKDAIGSVVEAGRKSDSQTRAVADGKSNMVDVVTAVVQTEVVVLIGTVLTVLRWPVRGRIMALKRADPVTVLPLAQSLAMKLLAAVVAMMAVAAMADYLFQYR